MIRLVQVEACKRNMNTFAFVGDLEKSPEVIFTPEHFMFFCPRNFIAVPQCSGMYMACCRRISCVWNTSDAVLVQAEQVSCVYHSEAAENQFLQNPRKSVLGDGYQARSSQALSAPGLDAPQ